MNPGTARITWPCCHACVYAPPSGVQAEPNSTFYQVFVGAGTAFEGPQGLRVAQDFPDGVSSTILFVEAGEAVPWTWLTRRIVHYHGWEG